MVTIEDAKRLCRQLEIKVINTADRPGPMRTSAVNTIRRMLADHGQEHTVVVLRAITEGNPANRTMLREDVIRAISDIVRAHPGWPERGGIWLEAWDSVDLGQIRHSAKASGIRPLRHAIGAMVCLRLTEILGPSVLPKQPKSKIKREPKPPAFLTRVPGVERNVSLGLELLKLRSAIKSNREYGRQVRRQFDVETKLAVDALKVARLYGARPEIYTRLSWNALATLACPTLPAATRAALEARICAGEQYRCARDPCSPRGSQGPQAPSPARSAGAADGGVIAMR